MEYATHEESIMIKANQNVPQSFWIKISRNLGGHKADVRSYRLCVERPPPAVWLANSEVEEIGPRRTPPDAMRLVDETLVENPAACRQHRNGSSIQGKTAAVPHFILHRQLRAEPWAQTLCSSGRVAQLDMHWHLVWPGIRKVRLGAVDYG